MHKVEIENASAGDAKGNFYTLKLIGDLKSDDAKLTSLQINGGEVLTGSVKNIKYETNYLSEDKYIDISKVGINLKDMTQASGVIEATDGYKENDSDTSTGNITSGSSGCNSLSLGMLFAALILIRKIR